VREDLNKKSSRITARDVEEDVVEDADSVGHSASLGFEIDREAFLKQ
jgi:hypothetical protein